MVELKDIITWVVSLLNPIIASVITYWLSRRVGKASNAPQATTAKKISSTKRNFSFSLVSALCVLMTASQLVWLSFFTPGPPARSDILLIVVDFFFLQFYWKMFFKSRDEGNR